MLSLQSPSIIGTKKVTDFIEDNGCWNRGSFSHLLPHTVIIRIASFMPPWAAGGADQHFWAESTKGHFTVKSAYKALSKIDYVKRGSVEPCVAVESPQSICLFIWLVLNDRLKTSRIFKEAYDGGWQL